MIQYIVILGAIISLTGALTYVKETIKGNTKPNRVTRLMRAIAPIIGTIAALYDGVHRSVLPVFMAGFGPLLVFFSSFVNKKAYRKLEKFDYICGIFSLLALILRRYTKQPVIAIFFAILSDALACIPTVIKGRKHPETESLTAFIAGLISVSTSFFAIKSLSFGEIAFPIYLVCANIILISAIIIGRKRIKNKVI